MNVLQRIKNAFTATQFTPTEETDVGSQAVTISTGGAKVVPVVYSAVNMLAYAIAPLPKQVVRVIDRTFDYYEPVEDHALNELLAQPSPYIDGHLFWSGVASQLLCEGNVHLLLRRNGRGQPVSLLPGRVYVGPVMLNHTRTTVMFTPWAITGDGKAIPVERKDLVSFHGPNFDGYCSPSPIMNVAYPTLQALTQGLDHQNSRFRSGLNAQIYVGTDASLEGIDVEQLQRKAQTLLQTYTTTRNRGLTPVLPPGYALKTVGTVSAVDLQIIQLLRWTVEDVARVWNYNPYMLAALSATGVMPAQAELADYFSRWTLPPPVGIMQSALARRLLNRQDKEAGYQIRFDLDRTRVGTWADQINAADLAATRAAVLTVNEVRRRLGYGPVEGGDELRSPKGSPPDVASVDTPEPPE